MSGRVVHFEIPYDNGERAQQFYADVFDWDISPLPEVRYLMAGTGPTSEGTPDEPGFINGGLIERGLPIGGPLVVLLVDDIDAALERIGRLGGTTVSAKQAVEPIGFSAYFKDTEGNVLGLWQRA